MRQDKMLYAQPDRVPRYHKELEPQSARVSVSIARHFRDREMHDYQALPYEAGRMVAFEREGANTVSKPSSWSRFDLWRTKRRTALMSGVFVVSLTFLINASALVYMHTHRITEVGTGTPLNPRLYLGDCAVTSKYNRYLHLGINVLSTLLLASSNMFMQLLLAPTRAQVDKAHRRQRWLDIGVFNLNNLRVVSWRSRVLWFILASSSLPLHLLYNSVIYASKPMNDITIHIVTPEFLTGAPASVNRSRTAWGYRREQNMWGLEREHSRKRNFKFQDIDLMGFMSPTKDVCTAGDDSCTRILDKVRNTDYYERKLSPLECLTAYSSINGNRSDVVMVSAFDSLYNVSTSNIRYQRNGSELLIAFEPEDLPRAPLNSFLFAKGIPSVMAVGFWYDYYWLCGNTNSFDCRRVKDWEENPDIMKDWNMLGWKIDHCLSHEVPVEDKCSVSYSPHLASVVCFVNFVKLACMLYCVRILSDENPMTKPLSTIGDAINSFLLDEDATTRHLNLADRYTLAKLAKAKASWDESQPRAWKPTSTRWSGLVSKRRMIYSSLAWTALILGGGAAMMGSFMNLTGRSGSVGHILDIPFGDTDQYTFGQLGLDIMPEKRSSMMKGFLSIVFFANMWQFLISIAYIILNGVFTGMCVEKEWQSYAHRSKTLRVSSPIGQQRSTYFLSLPLRYAIPMMATFATLHWLMSQSIFLTVLATYNANGLSSELLYLGSSPRPLITIVSVGVILAILMICICRIVHHGALPRGGSCSAVISAACHGPPGDSDARFGPVRWGEIETVHGQVYTYDQEGKGYEHEEQEGSMYGHCCFTSYEVVMPRVGRWYV